MYFRFKTMPLIIGMQKKKKENVTDPQKIESSGFFCFFLIFLLVVYLFKHLRSHLLIY